MKKKLLLKNLKKYGWYLKRHGANHDIWTNGELDEYVPRHKEVKEKLARKIIKETKNNPNY